MEDHRQDIDTDVIQLADLPLHLLLTMEDTVLGHSLRRVAEEAMAGAGSDAVSAFNSSI
ncbi:MULTISPECIES: FxSxx-COOH cyclophane-containing RiPP peptide [Polymorphospora]|uniref:FxSxx-COOH cyclophane-containing RiPP peptide n=1 Tax=Polymorphospora lycopeni TaxID=3140240 RepID=A0ABV5CMF0_9ACTN